jgi:hypothetical protein
MLHQRPHDEAEAKIGGLKLVRIGCRRSRCITVSNWATFGDAGIICESSPNDNYEVTTRMFKSAAWGE